jgi:hypothetical protein
MAKNGRTPLNETKKLNQGHKTAYLEPNHSSMLKTAFSGSNRLPDLQVKENVFKQNLFFFDSMNEFRKGGFVNIGFGEIGFQDASLTISKDVTSHNPIFSGNA